MIRRMNEINNMFSAMDLLRNRMDKIFKNFDSSFLNDPVFSIPSNTPKTNLIEDGDHFEVQAELPGVSKEALDIKIQGKYLEISGERTIDTPEGYKVHRSERVGSTFSKSFTLPDNVDADKVDATLKDGILYLNLPKLEAEKPKMIEVKAG